MNAHEAEAYLLSLELFGMRFGLERMHRLLAELDHPERRFSSIHVVGTNGKSSTTRMIAAILERHGVSTGAYLSPHLVSFAERIRIGEQDLPPAQLAAAVERARVAAERVESSLLEEGDVVTQFELLTAVAFSALADRRVDVAVIEAGLGGRHDATNVIDSSVQVLTGVGLEHTRWLGSTIAAIAEEKLDVVRPGGILVLGNDLHPDALAVARRVAGERGARIVRPHPAETPALGALGSFQRRNFALARAAAEAKLGGLEEAAVTAAAAETVVPGRLQVIAEHPLTLLDGAHNPAGMAALVESLPELLAGHAPVVGLISVLEDKDAGGMLERLVPDFSAVVFTSSRNPRALAPEMLASVWRELGGGEAEVAVDPCEGLARARELAGGEGAVVGTGSIYLVADLLGGARAARASAL